MTNRLRGLRERLGWVTPEEIQEAESAREQAVLALRSFVTHAYWPHFKDRLKMRLRAAKVSHKADEKDILYRLGFRDGLESILEELDALEQIARASQDS